MMIFQIINQVFTIYTFMIIGYILMSWIPAAQDSAVGRFLATLVEPYLGIFRKFIPPLGMIDISPIVALFALRFIQQGVITVASYIVF
ncbi:MULTISPECIES: YggT family protein [Bacillales]|uniref:YggT family protein n=1 Tax=Lysinibacillus louembei TaxID=1470088 RepID=A0ABZ0S3J0_9BACI|nr:MULTISPECIES: YggT family protein [Bacillales]MCT6924028.1 YggT family protein [Metasolibacillus sp.]MCT6940114.1 YggT family protein [Metasolibacillus sp.]WPK12032.1 YggT family protein [Lysinibacillus louembei]